MMRETDGEPVRRAGSARKARREMEARVARLAAGGLDGINQRLLELNPRPNSRRRLEAEEWCALKALRGDFRGLPVLDTTGQRTEVSSFEGEGGRAAEEGEEEGGHRRDRVAVRDALRAARGAS